MSEINASLFLAFVALMLAAPDMTDRARAIFSTAALVGSIWLLLLSVTR
jgi:hypothetical protein